MAQIPQLIIFLSPNDQLMVEESGANGVRRKVTLEPGWELASIRDALYQQRDRIAAKTLAERAALANEKRLRSERVIARVAINHGTGFAKQVFGEKYAQRGNLAPKPKVATSLSAIVKLTAES